MKQLLMCLVAVILIKTMVCDSEKNDFEATTTSDLDLALERDAQNSIEEDQPSGPESKIDAWIRVNAMRCRCGVGNNANKIVGGQQSGNHAWPWAAAIVNVGSGNGRLSVICGGSLINTGYVLTAAHCTPSIIDDISSYKVILGDNLINNSTESSRLVVGIQSVHPHPRYNSSNEDFDAALLRLDQNITFSTNVLPICLGQAGRPFVNRQATVCGWGTTFYGGSTVNALRDTRLKVITNDKCQQDFGTVQPVTQNMICAYTEGKDSCQGDSGGPLFVNRTTAPTVFKQIGIVSTGIGCADGKPGINTRVQRIISWIKFRTNDARYCGNSFTP